MKHSKKLLSLLLVLCMVLSLTCTAFAAEEEPVTLASWSGGTSLTNNGSADVLSNITLSMKDNGEGLNAYGSLGITTSTFGNLAAQPWYGTNNFSETNYGYIEFTAATTGYENLVIETVLGNNGKAPAAYRVEISADGGKTWTAAETKLTAPSTKANTLESALTSSVSIPATAADQTSVVFRIEQDVAANNANNAGNLYVYSIALTGTKVAETDPTPPVEKSDDIVVLYTNDVHCQVDPAANKEGVQTNAGYTNVAAYKADMLDTHNYVTLVDCGDAIQGGPIGAMTKGEAIVTVMNTVGYDIATFGNHEFDYGMDQLAKLVESAHAQYISCNFTYTGKGTAKVSADPYVIKDYGDTKVAFVGISTPESFTKSTPTYFQDENGNYVYSFAEGNNGQDLYDAVQKAVDDAKTAGANYVVAVAHTGTDESSTPWTSNEVIANTTGIDVYLDGHSHSTIAGDKVANKDGEEVILTSTGTKLKNIGKLVIGAEGITTELVSAASYTGTNEAASTEIAKVEDELNKTLTQVVAKSDVDLTTLDPETGKRAVRSAETNLGDLCADAYRVLYNTDIGFVNGGGIRADIKAGDITFEDIINVHPFSNEACVVKVSGQAILDALELSASAYPGENGGFLQVSGLCYGINSKIPSSVVKDDKGAFVKVDGERRVSNVYLLNDETGKYDIPIDPEAVYTVASHNYMLLSGGDGYTMFKNDPQFEQDTTITPRLDNKVLIDYIVEELSGVVGEEYANLTGEGRIFVRQNPFTDVNNKTDWFAGAVEAVYQRGVMNGMTATTFEPDTAVSRAMVATILYRLADSPAVSDDMSCPFTDVQKGDWYYDAIVWAYNKGILKGVSETLAAPNADATREQVAVLFYRFAGNPEEEPTGAELEAILSVYPDADQIAPWAKIGVAFCTDFDLMQGDDGFRPQNNMTRAELAQVIVNFVLAATSQPDEVPEAPEAITEAVLAA